VSFPTPTRAVDEEETWWNRPVRVCKPESSDVVRDGVVGDSLEVVEAGFLLCDLSGEGLAVVKEMGFQNFRLQVRVSMS